MTTYFLGGKGEVMLKNMRIKSFSENLLKISYTDLLIRKEILWIFILALFLFLKPFEENPNTLEVHQFEEATEGYHTENILKDNYYSRGLGIYLVTRKII